MEFTLEFFSNDRYDILKLLCDNQIKYYINPDEASYKKISEDGLQDFLKRIEQIRVKAKTQ